MSQTTTNTTTEGFFFIIDDMEMVFTQQLALTYFNFHFHTKECNNRNEYAKKLIVVN